MRTFAPVALAVVIIAGTIAGILILGVSSLPPAVNDTSRGVLPALSEEPAGQSFIPLPAPSSIGTVSVEKAIAGRRSVREFSGPLPGIADIAQMLWAMQGITDESGYRAAPSAGALYPLEISFACGELPGLSAGAYHYLPGPHALERIVSGDVRENLYAGALRQDALRNAPVVFIIAADYNRTTQKYGSRGIRYVDMEAGHAAQNLYLQAYALGYGTVAIGAFEDDGVRSILGLPPDMTPLYLLPVGSRAP